MVFHVLVVGVIPDFHFVLPSTSMMMHQFVVGVRGVVGWMGADLTVGPCQQYAIVFEYAIVDYYRAGYYTIGSCQWLIVVIVGRAHYYIVSFDRRWLVDNPNHPSLQFGDCCLPAIVYFVVVERRSSLFSLYLT